MGRQVIEIDDNVATVTFVSGQTSSTQRGFLLYFEGQSLSTALTQIKSETGNPKRRTRKRKCLPIMLIRINQSNLQLPFANSRILTIRVNLGSMALRCNEPEKFY